MKTIGIVGCRSRDSLVDHGLVCIAFEKLYQPGDQIVSGGCPRGGDRFAEQIAKECDVPIKIYPADWENHGRSAGFLRNTDIARDADVLIACVAPDRQGGTEDTIAKFRKLHPDGELVLV